MRSGAAEVRTDRTQEGNCAIPLVPVLAQEFYNFLLFITAQYSTYLLLQIFQEHGLSGTADIFVLIELDILLVNTGPSKVKGMGPVLLFASRQIIPQAKISLGQWGKRDTLFHNGMIN